MVLYQWITLIQCRKNVKESHGSCFNILESFKINSGNGIFKISKIQRRNNLWGLGEPDSGGFKQILLFRGLLQDRRNHVSGNTGYIYVLKIPGLYNVNCTAVFGSQLFFYLGSGSVINVRIRIQIISSAVISTKIIKKGFAFLHSLIYQ